MVHQMGITVKAYTSTTLRMNKLITGVNKMLNQKLDLTTVNINELINFTSAMIQFDNADLIASAQEVTAKCNN
jgi:hypothetical protein